MRLQYQIKRMEHQDQIEQCNKFFIEQYMWNSKQEPKTYGWLGYLEEEGEPLSNDCMYTNFEINANGALHRIIFRKILKIAESEYGQAVLR